MVAVAKPREKLILVLIVAGGAAVRFIGLGFGLPHNDVRPDELTLIALVMNFFSGDLNPHFFSYPSLLMYLLFILYCVYFLLGLAVGRFHSLADFIGAFATDPSSFFLISRGMSAVLGTLSIVALYAAASRLLDKSTALLAACFLAFAYLHARDSHFGTTDVAVTFFVIASYVWIASAWDAPTPRRLALAGWFAGLAASTKYMGVLLCVPVLLNHWLRPAPAANGRRWLPDAGLIAFALAGIAAFVAGTPFALVEAGRVRGDFSREIHTVWAMGYPLPPGWIYHAATSLRFGLGWPLFAASLAGCIVLLRRDWKKGAIFLSFPCLYYALMGKGNRDFVRYAIPLVPFLCVTAALLLMRLHAKVRSWYGGGMAALCLGASALLVLSPSLLAIWSFDRLLTRVDTRVAARRFVESSVPAGSEIAEFSSSFGTLDLSPTAPALQREMGAQSRRGVEPIIDAARLAGVLAGSRPGYELWQYDAESKKFLRDGDPAPGSPEYLILEESPLRFYPARIPPEIRELVDRSYVLIKTFPAFQELPRSILFNEMDAFYVPFAHFAGYGRPGPNIFVYQRVRDDPGSPGGKPSGLP